MTQLPHSPKGRSDAREVTTDLGAAAVGSTTGASTGLTVQMRDISKV
jgi:hypothetical protein